MSQKSKVSTEIVNEYTEYAVVGTELSYLTQIKSPTQKTHAQCFFF